MLRLLAARVVVAQSPGVSLAAEQAVPAPNDAPEASSAASWEAALEMVQPRDWAQGRVAALWMQHRNVVGLHMVLAVGVTIQGRRQLLGRLERGPQDVDGMAAFLHDLQHRGVSARTGLMCTVPSDEALRRAARTVRGSDVALQRCLRTKTMEMISILELEEARPKRHRLRLAWMLEDAWQAATPSSNRLGPLHRSEGCAAGNTMRCSDSSLLNASMQLTHCLWPRAL